MTDIFDQIQWLQDQIWELQRSIEQLQMENQLLTNDLNTIKIEGCYRFIEDKHHKHE